MRIPRWIEIETASPAVQGRARRRDTKLSPRRLESSIREADVRCLLALGARRDVERHALAFLQRLEPGLLNRAEMREQVLPAVLGRDETEAPRVVEPLHGA